MIINLFPGYEGQKACAINEIDPLCKVKKKTILRVRLNVLNLNVFLKMWLLIKTVSYV